MKFFWPLLLLISQISFAKSTKLLKCLGQEEQRIHQQKIGGAYYQLNQDIISFVIQFPDKISIKDNLVKEVCTDRSSESLQLLRLFLTMDTAVFTSPLSAQNAPNTNRTDLLKMSLKIFLRFVSKYQEGLSNAQCLHQKIPELKSFFEKTRYFETDVKITHLIKQLKGIDIIFDKLLSPKLTKDC